MTPQEFTDKWRRVELKERTASQSHFIDLCRLLGIVDPVAAAGGRFGSAQAGDHLDYDVSDWMDWQERAAIVL